MSIMNSSNGERWRRFRLFRRKKKRMNKKTTKAQLHPTIFEEDDHPQTTKTPNTTVEEEDDDSIFDSSIVGPSNDHNNQSLPFDNDEEELFEVTLQLEETQRQVIAEQRRVVRALENTCAGLAEILRVHRQSLVMARARLDKQRRDDPTTTVADPEALLPLESALEEMYQEQYRQQKSVLGEARKRLQETIQSFQEDHADDSSVVAPMSMMAEDGSSHSSHSPVFSRSSSHDLDSGKDEEKKGESSINPFDDHDEDDSNPFDSSGIVSVDDFVNQSQQFSKKLSGFLQQQNLMDWMQKDQLQDHMKKLQIQKEQTERAVECLQDKLSEGVNNTPPKKNKLSEALRRKTPLQMRRPAKEEDSDVESC